MRVVVVGAGEEEGQFLKNLSEKGAGKLVDGLYALWDPRYAAQRRAGVGGGTGGRIPVWRCCVSIAALDTTIAISHPSED